MGIQVLNHLIRQESSNYFSKYGRFLLASVFFGITLHTQKSTVRLLIDNTTSNQPHPTNSTIVLPVFATMKDNKEWNWGKKNIGGGSVVTEMVG